MIRCVFRVMFCAVLVCVLALPSRGQNTKGDNPATNRETRFKKTAKKVKPAKRVKSKRTTSSLRDYRPRKKSKGGERAARPIVPVYKSKPSDVRTRNVYPQSGPYVNNSSKKPRRIDRVVSSSQRRVTPRTASGTVRRVYPQAGKYVNYSSTASEKKPPRNKRIKPRSASRPFVRRRSVNAWANFPRPKEKRERAYRGDIAGKRIRTKNFESPRPGIAETPVRPQTATRRAPSDNPKARKLSATPSRRRANVYPQQGPYVNNPSRKPRRSDGLSISGAGKLSRTSSSIQQGPGKKRRIVPRSASKPFIRRRSTNVWAHYPRPKRKSEKAHVRDIAGKPLRTKNFETQRPEVLINPTARPYVRRKDMGDRAYDDRGRKFSSRTRTGKAWLGDITNRRIRKNFTSKRGVEGEPIVTPEKRRVGMRVQGEGFAGRLKARRAQKGGGSISGRAWNNKGRAVPARAPGIGGRVLDKYQGNIRFGRKGFNNQGEEYSGNVKTRRLPKGGGSVSGRVWNNQGRAIEPRAPGIGGRGLDKYQGNIRFGRKGFNNQGEEYSGNVKTRRLPKGGGSVSGRVWNNQGRAIQPRAPGIGGRDLDKYQGNIRFGRRGFNNQGEEYSGNIKARRPARGGGSVSGKVWNNDGRAVAGKTPGIGARSIDKYQGNIRFGRRGFTNQGEEYTGNIRARRPLKGGGSVSGRVWNNHQTPLPVRSPSKEAMKAGGYPGKIKKFQLKPGFNDQGEGYTGNIKWKRPAKGGGSVSGKLWNNDGVPVAVRVPRSNQGEESSGKLKSKRGYVKNPNSSALALKKQKPTAETFAIGESRIRMKRRSAKNPNAVDDALKKDKPSRVTFDIADTKILVKRKSAKNPNAADGALRTKKPAAVTFDIAESKQRIKKSYSRNPNASDDAMKGTKPSSSTYAVSGLQVKVKRREFGRRNGTPDDALPTLKPGSGSMKASVYSRSMKRSWDYVKNPNSADDALRVREPGKALARIGDYQGNIRLRKFDLFGKQQLHPDARFVKTNKNNVAEEKDMLTNFKLWWARLFRKSETQPDHLKDKGHKPRYDKGEAGLWYD